MKLDLPKHVTRLLRSVAEGEGHTSTDLRKALLQRACDLSLQNENPAEIPEELKKYLDKVILWAYKTLDEEVDELREAGYSEDEIFELTIAASLGAGKIRFERGLAALEAAMGEKNANID